jgi:hypothetical protein
VSSDQLTLATPLQIVLTDANVLYSRVLRSAGAPRAADAMAHLLTSAP